MDLLVEKRVPATREALTELLDWLELELQPLLPKQQMLRALLVAEEAAVNVVTYAYPSGWKVEPYLIVRLALCEDFLLLQVEDGGIPFDPLQTVSSDAAAALEKRQPGGWGRVFLEKFTAARAYSYNDGKNFLNLFFSRAVS